MKTYTKEQVETVERTITAKGPHSFEAKLKLISFVIDVYGKESPQALRLIAKFLDNSDFALTVDFLHNVISAEN